MRLDPKEARKIETSKRRGWILYLLFICRPKPRDFAMLTQLMDARDYPMSCQRLAEELEFLRSLKLLRVFPRGSDKELSNIEQAKLIQRYCDSDGEEADNLCVAITTRGVNFQEGYFEEIGITRINR